MNCDICGEPLDGIHILDGCPRPPRTRDEIIEQAARFACTARPGHDHQPRLDQECAWVLAVCENLAGAGLLARPLPSRDEIAGTIAGRLYDPDSPRDLAPLSYKAADAVLELLKGQDR